MKLKKSLFLAVCRTASALMSFLPKSPIRLMNILIFTAQSINRFLIVKTFLLFIQIITIELDNISENKMF